jgi:hypothetical protein
MFQLLTLVQTTANSAKEVAANYIKTVDVNNIVQQIKEKVIFLRYVCDHTVQGCVAGQEPSVAKFFQYETRVLL